MKVIESERNTRENELKNNYEKQINSLKADSMSHEKSLTEGFERAKKDAEQRIREAESRISQLKEKLETETREKGDTIRELERTVKDSQKKYNSMEHEHQLMSKQMGDIVEERNKLRVENQDLDKRQFMLAVDSA